MGRTFTFLLGWALLHLAPAPATAAADMVFVHHSSGRYLLADGDVRTHLATLGGPDGPHLWDHDFNAFGLSDPTGASLDYSFDIPDDNTDPDGLHTLWTTANAARDSLLSRFDVIAFKSCYHPALAISREADLEQYKAWYLDMRDVFDTYPDRVFLIMSPPALHQFANSPEEALRARAFADWLGSPEFLGGHPNLRYFDLFDLLADPEPESPTFNMLQVAYERSESDWHPNAAANAAVGPLFAQALLDAAASAVPASTESWGGMRAMFR